MRVYDDMLYTDVIPMKGRGGVFVDFCSTRATRRRGGEEYLRMLASYQRLNLLSYQNKIITGTR